jgi:hypothetical protein
VFHVSGVTKYPPPPPPLPSAPSSQVLPSSGSFTVFAISSSAFPPGRGVMALLPLGTLPTTTALGGLLTTNTSTDPFYGSTASPASFVFQNSTWLWVCDDGGLQTRGVWLFTLNSLTGRFRPESSASRLWSSAECSDIALQVEGSVSVLYWVGDISAGNGIYRMPTVAPYSPALVTSAPGTLLSVYETLHTPSPLPIFSKSLF